jgi:hypothetical protein
MLGQRDATVGGTPELMEAFGATAAGVAEVLLRQSIMLREARERARATGDPAFSGGRFPETDLALRSIVDRIRDLGETASRAGAALRTADTTARMDIVFMSASQFTQVFGSAHPHTTPAPTPGPAPPTPPGPGPAPGGPTTVEDWRRVAYERAGVDTKDWDTSADMRTNDQRIRAIWDRYGQLYLANPKHLWWAGMAKFAGATVYAGMMDLKSVVDIADAEARRRALRQWIEQAMPGVGDDAAGHVLSVLVDLTGNQLNDFLDAFQRMEKAIADDLLWQHEVYRAAGLAALLPLVDRAYADRPDERRLLHRGWTEIDSGDPARVAAGTRDLVDVEQNYVLPPHFREMRSSPAGFAFAEILTFTAESPVPGGQAYRDVMIDKGLGDDILHGLGIPDPDVPFYRWDLPAPLDRIEGNLTLENDRWKWITRDMSPAYERFLAQHPDQMKQAMNTPVTELANARRKSPLPYQR